MTPDTKAPGTEAPDTKAPGTKAPDLTKLDALFGHLKPRYVVYATEVDLPPVRKVGYDYILAGNGLFKRAANDHLEACICVQSFRIATLLSFSEYIQPASKFPGHLLGAIHEDAERFAQTNQERMYFLHADPEEEKRGRTRFWVSMPSQESQSIKVNYGPSHFAQTVVCDLHSHHTMRAFFSGPAHVPDTDDHDEQGFGFYAVIGNMLQSRPELRLRLGMYGDFLEVPADVLFEGGLGLFTDAYKRSSDLCFDRPAEWHPGGDGSEGDSSGFIAEWFSSLNVPDDLWGKISELCLADSETPETLIARLIEATWEQDFVSPEGTHRDTMLGPELFTFASFPQWVNKAKSWFANSGVLFRETVCLDTAGRICTCGKELMRARDENTYPITVYHIDPDFVPSKVDYEALSVTEEVK